MTKENQTTSTLEQYIQLLQDKKNIILQGAPGTGKTYTTASLAVRLCNPNFSDWGDRTAVLAAYEELRQGGQIAFCTFHQSLDYEDFIEGLKPQLQGSHVTYNIEAGIFKRICERARRTERTDIITCIDNSAEDTRKREPTRNTLDYRKSKAPCLVGGGQ